MRVLVVMTSLFLATTLFTGCSKSPEELGLAFSAETKAERVKLLVDETWTDAEGTRHIKQEIFDSVFDVIDEAERFILLDFFLVNQFLFQPGSGMRHLSQELADKLVAKRKSNPEVEIIFITDPVNTVYESIESPQFNAMKDAGVQVVWSDLDTLRDSNPICSKPWRLFVKGWGVGPGNAIPNPMGEGRISVRSMLTLLNFKANHRKVIVTEKSLLVTSGNPHSGSSAHWNVALRVDGAGMAMACEAESAILRMSGASGTVSSLSMVDEDDTSSNGNRLELLTEIRIKEKVLSLLANAEPGARIDLSMFYLADNDVIRAFIAAQKRGCKIRVILDPAKDAFGRIKNGIPNRQSAYALVQSNISLRWANTHGEQCHVKMLYVEHADATATLLLGSCNFTRRNLDNFNGECDLAFTAPNDDVTMQRARNVFDRWWSNPEGRSYTVEYKTYEDPSLRRRLRASLMEITGMSTF
ncbi:MAG: phospholipase D-like domain-containing protein [Pontiella sp.]